MHLLCPREMSDELNRFALHWIDDMRISHNASGLEANIRVVLILNSSSHSSLIIYGLELPFLAATLCLYETRVTGVVRSCAVDAKVISSKT